LCLYSLLRRKNSQSERGLFIIISIFDSIFLLVKKIS
jgi:hypothetical protein